jgi:hypothetical protein
MTSNNQDESPLFEVIPPYECTPEQEALWGERGKEAFTFKLLREPSTLKELINYGNCIAIWHEEHKTMTYVARYFGVRDPLDVQVLDISFGYANDAHLEFKIVGRTEAAVAETAAFWIGCEKAEEGSEDIKLYGSSGHFDFRNAGSHCFVNMLQIRPLREVVFHRMMFSAEQAHVLATRPYASNLNFWDCTFEDEGTAFVDGIQSRQSPLGCLALESFSNVGGQFFNYENMRRFCQSCMMEELLVSSLKEEWALLPFSAKAESLFYISLSSTSLMGNDLQSLNIATPKLNLIIEHDDSTVPTELLTAFWRRVATLGHFVELRVTWESNVDSFDVPECVIHEIIQAALANRDLRVLDFTEDDLNMNPHVGTLLEGLKDHNKLSTIKMNVDVESFGHDYSHIRKLISHNKNIVVTSIHDYIYTDGSTIDDLYSINRFYRGSADLPLTLRPSLVATALTEIASNDFRRSALLLSQHVDVLHELVLFAKFEERLKDSACSRLKRTIRNQPSRAAKKR